MTTSGKSKSKASAKSAATPAARSIASSKAAAKERRVAAQRRRRQQQQTLLVLGAVTLLASVVLVIFVSTRPLEGFVPDGIADKYATIREKGYQGRTEDGYYFIGNPAAPITMEMFSSYSCSACAQYKATYFEGIRDKIEGGDVKFIYIPLTSYGSFPSDGMVRGAICAGEQGKFWEMSDVLFNWPGRYGSDSNNYRRLSDAAGTLGLDRGKFDACLNSADTGKVIDKAAALAAQRGISATPTVYLDGEKIYPEVASGGRGPDVGQLRGIIESKVAQN